jgi:hypothetical protein
METGISEIVGHAELADGGRTQVYRALRALVCAACGSAILEGTLFTRRAVKGIGLSIMPQCPECAPFTLQTGKREKSALLRSLLAEQPADSPVRGDAPLVAGSEEEAAAAERVREEIRRRLGPALKRGRPRQ